MNKKTIITTTLFTAIVVGILSILVLDLPTSSNLESEVELVDISSTEKEQTPEPEDTISTSPITTPEDNVVYLGDLEGEKVLFATNNTIKTYYQIDGEGIYDSAQLGQVIQRDQVFEDQPFINVANLQKLLTVEEGYFVRPSSIFEDDNVIYFGTHEVEGDKDKSNKLIQGTEDYFSRIYKYIKPNEPEIIWEFDETFNDEYLNYSGRARLSLVENGYAVISLPVCYGCMLEDKDLSIIVNLKTKEETILERALVIGIDENGILSYQKYIATENPATGIWEPFYIFTLEEDIRTLDLN